MKKVGPLFFLFFLFSSLAVAQGYKGQGKVMGLVTDEQGNPLEGVTIKLYCLRAQSGFETVTDEEGKWKAFYIRGGPWNIDFEKLGYAPKKLSAQLREFDKNPRLEVMLKKIEGLVITDELKEELKIGNDLFAEEKYQEAIDVYSKILADFPDAYIIDKNIGNCYFQLEKYDLAEEHYQKVLNRDPKNSEIMLAIGNTYANRGDNEKALEWYDKIPFEEIDDAMVLFNIGSNFYQQSKFENALKFYKKAVEIQDDFLDVLYQLGLVNLTLGHYKDAIDAFEKYLTQDPDSERAAQVKNFINFLRTKIEEQ